ncbi:MAG: hypothetical protein GX625_04790 [Clostridiaceae bacterium]|nr:hypothetical protein [Clostridiaceae bacterium]
MNIELRYSTITLLAAILKPWVDNNVISTTEFNYIISNLKHLEAKNDFLPNVIPKLITQQEAANMLGVGLSHFKKMEKEGQFSFKRRMVGTAVRYRNTDIHKYINSD